MGVRDRGERRVVIVGGGFAGIAAARGLSGADCDVTLVDRRNHHLFQPLLYQVATSALAPNAVAQPIRHILRRARNVRVHRDVALSFAIVGGGPIRRDDTPCRRSDDDAPTRPRERDGDECRRALHGHR